MDEWLADRLVIAIETAHERGTDCKKGEGRGNDGWLAVFVDASYTSMYEDGVWGGEREVEVAPDGPPLLFGRLAQLVLPPSLDYDVVEDEDGRRVVKVELKKASTELPVPLSSGSPCIFDETLMLSGEACAVPGLSVEHNEASRLEP